VLGLVVLAVAVGGGRKWLQAIRARRALRRALDHDVTAAEVERLADHGRAAILDLFRLQHDAPTAAVRDAAGRGLSHLWARDQLVPEEEKAIVTRGFSVTWKARRRYPRALRGPIPIAVDYGVPFLLPDGPGVRPANLEWSHRILGAQRATLENFSPWRAGPGRAEFDIEPADFAGPGPHRLVLQARVRTSGLTSSWELDLPHIPFSFEFDTRLDVGAILSTPDAALADRVAAAIQLRAQTPHHAESIFLPLNGLLAIRNPPSLVLASALPVDLAHDVGIEFENVAGHFPAGTILAVSGTPSYDGHVVPLGPVHGVDDGTLNRPGAMRLRAILEPNPDRGWTDPEVRSVWPETIVTDWCDITVVRR
jgi:hypothetical protein